MYEIDGPAAWVRLVGRYPLEVSRSRRHDWYRTTGRVGRWFIPDWPAMAGDYDGVHLTVAAYLATAGRALPLDEADGSAGDGADGATVLAGWDPDATIWLADRLAASGPATRWRRSREHEHWAVCAEPAK
ncbi:hypothetical protein ACL02T_17110 [Pseudonocardia sp. RS010]|uniref:hypothetical protein n=1 Tax=Pseudonocardia sp. RS010 TaxID=3385979 RepID=UPI00399F168A